MPHLLLMSRDSCARHSQSLSTWPGLSCKAEPGAPQGSLNNQRLLHGVCFSRRGSPSRSTGIEGCNLLTSAGSIRAGATTTMPALGDAPLATRRLVEVVIAPVVYSFKDGRVSGQGFAKIVGKKPLFDEKFALTGGTRKFSQARDEVRVVQTNETEAELYLRLQH